MIKNLFLIILSAMAAFDISAQTAKASSNSVLTVIENKWHFVENSYVNTSDESDPFRANDEQREFTRATAQNMRANEIRTSQGLPAEGPPSRINSFPDDTKPARNGSYIYQIKVKNTGQKNIRFVIWDYIFIDTNNNKEAGRRHFLTLQKISAGETGKLTEKSNFYPTTTIDASKSGKKFKDSYSEQIVIKQIEFDDGTVWKAQ